MKKTIALLLLSILTISLIQAQFFDGNHPGYVLLGRSGPLDGYGLTNLTSMVFTNTATGYLTTGSTQTTGAAGFLSVSVILTNTQIVWLTNQTSHVCVWMGNAVGVWTNYDHANIMCNAGDSVLVTNISGSGGAGLVQSYYQVLH